MRGQIELLPAQKTQNLSHFYYHLDILEPQYVEYISKKKELSQVGIEGLEKRQSKLLVLDSGSSSITQVDATRYETI